MYHSKHDELAWLMIDLGSSAFVTKITLNGRRTFDQNILRKRQGRFTVRMKFLSQLAVFKNNNSRCT